jgi:hypothetical protein
VTELAVVSKPFEPIQNPTLAFSAPYYHPSRVEARGGGSGSVPTQADAPPSSPTRGQLPRALTEGTSEDLANATATAEGQGKLTELYVPLYRSCDLDYMRGALSRGVRVSVRAYARHVHPQRGVRLLRLNAYM